MKHSSDNNTDWDYIIVGGGSSGCVLANRLSKDAATRVLLVEAGRSDGHLYSRIPAAIGLAIESPSMNWRYHSLPDISRAKRAEMWPAGRMLGGGSAINGMMYVRGNSRDYDHWEELGNTGWGFEGVLPYFRKLEDNERGGNRFRGSGGPVSIADVRISSKLTSAFVEAMVEMGIPRNGDLNGESQEGVDYCQVTQRRGLRESTSRAYITPIRHRRNLRVELNALVTRVLVGNREAKGIEYEQSGHLRTATASRGVIIAAGAIGSPKILMLSGIGCAKELEASGITPILDLPGVGRNLQEHPGFILSAHVSERTLTSDRNPFRALMHGLNFLFRGRGPLSNPVGHAQAFVRTRENLDAPNIQIIFSPLSFDHHEHGATPYTKPAVNIAVGLCRVSSRGQVRLASADPMSGPIIDYSLLSENDDVLQLMEGVKLARGIFQTRAFGKYFRDERKPGAHYETDELLEECIRQDSFLMYHACGTCSMGVHDMAVVGPDLRLRGLDKLWVADASVIPAIPAGNINATCIMIGEKAADLIREGK